MREAKFYERLEKNEVRCLLCPQHCRILPGKGGVCRQRINENGFLYAKNYGEISSAAMDPVEKKPLYHFYPGESILSIGTIGCNFHCDFCQNWSIAQKEAETMQAEPGTIVVHALREESIGIAFTYNEPTVWYEFVLDTCRLSHEHKLKNVLVTNGFMEKGPLEELIPFVDAMNIDVKAFSEEYYRKVCGGTLKGVRETVERAAGKCHVEITALIVNGLNDSREEIREMAVWLASVDPTIPLHLSRYFPNYKMQRQATPIDTLLALRDTAKELLEYVYVGNVPGIDNNTYCPRCGEELVDRSGYRGRIVGISQGQCQKCRKGINIVY